MINPLKQVGIIHLLLKSGDILDIIKNRIIGIRSFPF
jgi:hypothetical protein